MSWTSIIVVSAILAAVPRYAPAVVEVDEVARIGVVDDEPEYLFGRISLISALKDGRVIAADSQLEQIRVYDSSGKYLGDIGRAGEGPGEYKGLQSMTALPDGQLVVLSSPGRRIRVRYTSNVVAGRKARRAGTTRVASLGRVFQRRAPHISEPSRFRV